MYSWVTNSAGQQSIHPCHGWDHRSIVLNKVCSTDLKATYDGRQCSQSWTAKGSAHRLAVISWCISCSKNGFSCCCAGHLYAIWGFLLTRHTQVVVTIPHAILVCQRQVNSPMVRYSDTAVCVASWLSIGYIHVMMTMVNAWVSHIYMSCYSTLLNGIIEPIAWLNNWTYCMTQQLYSLMCSLAAIWYTLQHLFQKVSDVALCMHTCALCMHTCALCGQCICTCWSTQNRMITVNTDQANINHET